MYFSSIRFDLDYKDVKLEFDPDSDIITITETDDSTYVDLTFEELEEIVRDFEVIKKYRKVE